MSDKTYRAIIAACFPELPITSCAIYAQGWDSVAADKVRSKSTD